jgi:hypothetical protein
MGSDLSSSESEEEWSLTLGDEPSDSSRDKEEDAGEDGNLEEALAAGHGYDLS